MNEAFLKNIFSQITKVVNIKIARDRVTGHSAGYGYIEFATHEDATAVFENQMPIPGTNKYLKLTWTTLSNIEHFSDPVAPMYHKYTNVKNLSHKNNNNQGEIVECDIELVNNAMKLNCELSGGAYSENLAHQFYYHIPHPTLPYVDPNLTKLNKHHYKESIPLTQIYYPQGEYYYDYGTGCYYNNGVYGTENWSTSSGTNTLVTYPYNHQGYSSTNGHYYP